MKNKIFTALLAVFLTGCAAEQPEPQNVVVTRIGNLSEDILQHPIVAEPSFVKNRDQFYFDVDDSLTPMRQIIVVYPVGMAIPTERGRKIKLKGTVSTFGVGGELGSKGEYKNEVFNLRNWKYMK